MSVLEKLNVGVVGAAGRGGSFRAGFDAHPVTRLHAVCDIREELLEEAAEKLGASEMYRDYEEMLAQSEVDAVVIGTPMPFHAPQAILALEQNIHVLSEVTAAVSVAECRALVATAKRSRAVYMMAENGTYRKPNMLVKELVRRGMVEKFWIAEWRGQSATRSLQSEGRFPQKQWKMPSRFWTSWQRPCSTNTEGTLGNVGLITSELCSSQLCSRMTSPACSSK